MMSGPRVFVLHTNDKTFQHLRHCCRPKCPFSFTSSKLEEYLNSVSIFQCIIVSTSLIIAPKVHELITDSLNAAVGEEGVHPSSSKTPCHQEAGQRSSRVSPSCLFGGHDVQDSGYHDVSLVVCYV